MTCPRCGANATGETFCTSCGERLPAEPVAAIPRRPHSTPSWLVAAVVGLAVVLVAGLLFLVLGANDEDAAETRRPPGPSVAEESAGQPTDDFTGDGRGDLAINTGDGIVVQASTGQGFSGTGMQVGAGDEAARGDVNGDGRADLVLASFTGTGAVLSVHLAGDDSFAAATESSLPGVDGEGRLLFGDVNGDGSDDAVGIGTDRVTVLLGGEDGLGEPRDWGPAPRYPGLGYPLLGRFTDDDIADLVYVHGGSSRVTMTVHQGGAAWFGDGQTWRDIPGWDIRNLRPIVGDFDGDGLSDLAELGRPSGGGADLMVLRSNGAVLEAPVQWMHNGAVDWEKTRVVSGDFDGDGRSDVLTLAPGPSGASIAEVRLSQGDAFGDARIWSSERWGDDPRPVGLGTGRLGVR